MGLFSRRNKPKPSQPAAKMSGPKPAQPLSQDEKLLSEEQARLMAKALSGLMKEK